MSSAKAETLHVDEARDWIAHHIAQLLDSGATQVRIRVVRPHHDPTEAWLYRHQNNQWVKSEWQVTEPALVIAIQDVAEMLSAHPPTPDWHTRRRQATDFEDTDITFHKESLTRRGADLESWLRGSLFKDAPILPASRRTPASR
jgi:hypothetical protein